MARELVPITVEEIAQIREEIDIGQALYISSELDHSREEKRWYLGRVIEKYKEFFRCEYRIKGKRITESFKYVQLACGDEIMLV